MAGLGHGEAQRDHIQKVALAEVITGMKDQLISAKCELLRRQDLRIGAALCAARLGRGGAWLAGVLREMVQEDAPEIREAAVSVLRAIGVSD